jgi:S-adenosylmethionine uptake transporter
MLRRTTSFLWPFATCCAGVALFTGMDAAIKVLSLSAGVFNALFWRAGAGCLMGGAAMVTLRLPWPSNEALRIHVLRGVVVSAMAPLFFFGVIRLPLAEAIGLSFVAPLIALFLAAALLNERITRSAIIASIMGLGGVVIILSDRLHSHYNAEAVSGSIAILAAAVLFAWNLILQRQQAQLASPIEVAFFQQAVALTTFILVAALSRWCIAPLLSVEAGQSAWANALSLGMPGPENWPMILTAAILGFVSLALMSWAYGRAEAQRLIPIEYSAFIWAAVLGWLFFSETPTFATLSGTALIVGGCLIATREGGSAPPPVERAAI